MWLKFKVSFKYLLGGIKICRKKITVCVTDKECVLKIVVPPLYRPETLTAYYFIRKTPPAATDNDK